MRQKIHQHKNLDTLGLKPVAVSQETPQADLPNCVDCGQPLTMVDIGASRKRHLFCPKADP